MGPLPRLYAILDADLISARGHDPDVLAAAWLDAGVRLFQLRAKSLTFGPMLRMAERLSAMARAADAQFIVNDRPDVAQLSGASGVHVGQQDLGPSEVRQLLSPGAIVGLSTHSREQFEAGLREPVTYLAVGPVFPTTTKLNADPVIGLEGVRWASAIAEPLGVPVVAIGGITVDTAPAVLAAGATSVAVITDLLAADPGTRARTYLRALA